MATTLVERGQQYKLHAYVCGNACVEHLDNIGTVTFTRIFTLRPDGCRYAVVAIWDTVKHAEEVVVFDLYEAMENSRSGKLIAPPPIWRGECPDAAIMATMMRYDDKS